MPKRRRDVKAPVIEEVITTTAPVVSRPEDNTTQPSPSKRRRVTAVTKVKQELVKAESVEQQVDTPTRGARKRDPVQVEPATAQENGSPEVKAARGRKQKIKAEVKVKEENEEQKPLIDEKKIVRKRKTKEEKAAEAMPLAARTIGHKLYIGAHVSSAGGVHNSVANSVHIGANAFALFLKSQRKWANPALADDVCASFLDSCKHHGYDQGSHVVPHGSYLVNLAHTDEARTEQAYESYLDDLKRCDRLGIGLYNIHPGNTASNDRSVAIAHLAKNINRAHQQTKSVVTLLENMAAGGNVLGSTFEDLRDIIALVDNKARIGVCLDTCHAFAAGYDLRSPSAWKATMDKLDQIVGFKYLRALHVNDSKAPLSSHRDLHANIGTGYLGLRAFHNLVNEPRLVGLPLVLESPIEVRDANGHLVKDEKGKEKEDKTIWATEIKMLESLVGMDTSSEIFLKLEKELARKGEPERKRLAEQIERKKEKELKKSTKSPRTKKAKVKEENESGLSELEEE